MGGKDEGNYSNRKEKKNDEKTKSDKILKKKTTKKNSFLKYHLTHERKKEKNTDIRPLIK